MSFRGRGGGRGGGYSGARGGGSFGGRGGGIVDSTTALPRLTRSNATGRGGFQQSYGPPASVLGP